MAENHRRVEPRQIIGTGMATDPRRVEDIEAERARFERNWREPAQKGFADVLTETPARPQENEDDPGEDPRRRRRREEEEARRKAEIEAARVKAATAVVAEGDETSATDGASDDNAPRSVARPTRRLPPDPREALLRRQLESKGAGRPRPGAPRRAPVPVELDGPGSSARETPTTGKQTKAPKRRGPGQDG